MRSCESVRAESNENKEKQKRKRKKTCLCVICKGWIDAMGEKILIEGQEKVGGF